VLLCDAKDTGEAEIRICRFRAEKPLRAADSAVGSACTVVIYDYLAAHAGKLINESHIKNVCRATKGKRRSRNTSSGYLSRGLARIRLVVILMGTISRCMDTGSIHLVDLHLPFSLFFRRPQDLASVAGTYLR
jgi:hypothetical protein